MRGGVEDFFPHFARRKGRCTAGQHHAAAGIGPGTAGDARAVALQDADVFETGAEMFGDDLGERRLKALAVRSNAEGGGDGAGRIDAHDCRLGAGIDRHAGRDRDARADAGELGVAGDADADPAAGGARLFLFGAQRVVADRGAGLVQAFLESGFVPDDTGGDLVGKLVVGDEIAQPDLLGIEAELCRRHVHQPFHDEGRDRPADAAIRPGRRLRGRHRLHAAAIVLHAIGAGQKAHDLHRLEPRGPRIDRIGADVADDVGAQRQNAAIIVERQFGVDDFVKTLAVGGEVFQAVAGPFDRALQQPRRGANKNFLRIERALAAKTAADIGRDDANAVPRNIERRRQRIADDAGHLRCRMQGQRVAARLVFGEAGARLDRDRALAMHAEPAFDPDRRRRKCRLRIAALELAADDDIGAGLVMQQRRAGDAPPVPDRSRSVAARNR